MEHITTIGIDLAKSVFQVCGLNKARAIQFNRRVSRKKLIATILQYPNAQLAMEACGSAHYWYRTFSALGFKVRLIPAQHVKAFSRGNKSDKNDALAIAESVFRPDIHDAQPKTLEQQDIQTLLRIRTRIQQQRKSNVVQLRSFLSEYGIVLPQGITQYEEGIHGVLEDGSNELTPVARKAIAELAEEHRHLSARVNQLEKELKALYKQILIAQELTRIRGVGPITALSIYASIGLNSTFKNARQLSAWLGLVPKQHGTGGKMRLGPISKRGNQYLRTLLIHGARSVLNWSKHRDDYLSQWAKQVAERRGKHKANVALANRTARMIWVVLNKGADALPDFYQS